jgi:SMC interacting uncharacterized protein involved in chromosome segregation
MEKEKEAFMNYLDRSEADKTDEERFWEYVLKTTNLYSDLTRPFYRGYHSRDQEIAALKAEIEQLREEILSIVIDPYAAIDNAPKTILGKSVEYWFKLEAEIERKDEAIDVIRQQIGELRDGTRGACDAEFERILFLCRKVKEQSDG